MDNFQNVSFHRRLDVSLPKSSSCSFIKVSPRCESSKEVSLTQNQPTINFQRDRPSWSTISMLRPALAFSIISELGAYREGLGATTPLRARRRVPPQGAPKRLLAIMLGTSVRAGFAVRSIFAGAGLNFDAADEWSGHHWDDGGCASVVVMSERMALASASVGDAFSKATALV
jgi:hypothetical protein